MSVSEHDLLEIAAELHCEEVHLFVDKATDLKAIIAIHNTLLGPALGGCRLLSYPSTVDAVIDAIRLAQAMTYKASIANLPLGGGKMVLLKPKMVNNREAYFKAVGRIVNKLNGRYITAVDSGTCVQDMDFVATETPHVANTSAIKDPSLLAAAGVKRGIEAAVAFKLGKDRLEGVSIAIQGLGHAGYQLAKLLHQDKAKLTVFDVNSQAVKRCQTEFGAEVCSSLDELLDRTFEVFAPCALGAVINDASVSRLKVKIVAGCANNQLLEPLHGWQLMEKNILYAPDYVINAGGLIHVAAQYNHMDENVTQQKISDIYLTLMEIFKRSALENKPTSDIANTIAEERLR